MNLAEPRRIRNERLLQRVALTLFAAACLMCCASAAASQRSQESASNIDLHIGMGIYYQVWNMRTAARNHFEEAWRGPVAGDPEVAIAAAVASYQGGDDSSALQWIKWSAAALRNTRSPCVWKAIYIRQAQYSYTRPRIETRHLAGYGRAQVHGGLH